MSNKRKHLARQKFGFFRQNKAMSLCVAVRQSVGGGTPLETKDLSAVIVAESTEVI